MIKISSPQNQLRQNRTLLLLTGGVSTVAGLFLWSATPFVFNNPKDKVGVCLRYLSLFGSLTLGIAAVASGHQLQRINPLLKAIETAERNDFLDQLASSQYVQQQQWQQQAVAALQSPAAVGNSFDGNGGNLDTASGNEVVTDSLTEPVTDATDNATLTAADTYKPMYLAVTALQQQGVAESKIIKDVLQQEGRNYSQGKAMLEALLQLGQFQGW
ncbi:MAG TPA: hypothetical protein V6D15_08450 [Oculatellaceae cyanobacterium]|jgi:hypothetical protein